MTIIIIAVVTTCRLLIPPAAGASAPRVPAVRCEHRLLGHRPARPRARPMRRCRQSRSPTRSATTTPARRPSVPPAVVDARRRRCAAVARSARRSRRRQRQRESCASAAMRQRARATQRRQRQLPAGLASASIAVTHARREVLPEERRRLGHVDAARLASTLAQLGRARRGRLARVEVRADAPVERVRRRASTSSSGVRWLMARSRGASSSSPARGRSWPSPRRPSCRGCRRSAGATARDTSRRISVARCFRGRLAIARRTAAARSSAEQCALRVLGPACRRSDRRSIGSVAGVFSADAIQADVDGNAIEPGRERRLGP